MGAHAKKHPASLQGTLGFLDFDGFTKGNFRFLGPKSIDLLGVQGWVSCGGCLVAEPPLYAIQWLYESDTGWSQPRQRRNPPKGGETRSAQLALRQREAAARWLGFAARRGRAPPQCDITVLLNDLSEHRGYYHAGDGGQNGTKGIEGGP